METLMAVYNPTICAIGAMAALLLLQILVVDVVGIKSRHIPGAPVAVDHASFLFRATRAHANTNESIAAFILLALFGMLYGVSPGGLNSFAWIYVIGRAAHMAFYYAGLKVLRSIAFGVGLIGLIGMLFFGIVAWF